MSFLWLIAIYRPIVHRL